MCEYINLDSYPKSRRTPKKKVVKKFDPKVKHVSTAKILELQKQKKFMKAIIPRLCRGIIAA